MTKHEGGYFFLFLDGSYALLSATLSLAAEGEH